MGLKGVRREAQNAERGLSTPRRGRPAKAGRQEDILEAALEAFSRTGFAATRIDDVARRAGISKGTIYLYFPSKEALFEGVVRHFMVPKLDRVDELRAGHVGSADDLLRMQLATVYREIVGSRLREILRLLLAEGPRFPELLAFYHAEVVDRAMAGLRATIELGIAQGVFRPNSARDFPQVVMGPAILAGVWTLLFDSFAPLDLDAYAEAHLDILLRGLAKDRTGC